MKILKNTEDKPLPMGLKFAAGFLVLSGLIGVILFVLHFAGLSIVPEHKEFTAKSTDYKIWSFMKDIVTNLVFIVSGVGLIFRKVWARKLALIFLVVSAYHEATAFAWGFAGGRPSMKIYLSALAASIVWHGIWFYLIYKKESAAFFKISGSKRDLWWQL